MKFWRTNQTYGEALPQEEEWWNFPNLPLMRANIWWQFKWSCIQNHFWVFFFSFLQQRIDNDYQHTIFSLGLQLNNLDKVHKKIVLTSRHHTDKDEQGYGWYYDMWMFRVLVGIMLKGWWGSWVVLWYYIIIPPNTEDQGIGWYCFLPNLQTMTAVVANPSPKPLPDAVSQAWSWWFLFLTIATRKISNSVPTASLQEIQEETDGA